MSWRSHDRPMPGSIYRLQDDRRLQRGITYTIMPDGKGLRVPANTRLGVRAAAESHERDQHADIMQALTDILKGKKPVEGRAKFNRHGKAHGNRVPIDQPQRQIRGAPVRVEQGDGLRPVNVAEE